MRKPLTYGTMVNFDAQTISSSATTTKTKKLVTLPISTKNSFLRLNPNNLSKTHTQALRLLWLSISNPDSTLYRAETKYSLELIWA